MFRREREDWHSLGEGLSRRGLGRRDLLSQSKRSHQLDGRQARATLRFATSPALMERAWAERRGGEDP